MVKNLYNGPENILLLKKYGNLAPCYQSIIFAKITWHAAPLLMVCIFAPFFFHIFTKKTILIPHPPENKVAGIDNCKAPSWVSYGRHSRSQHLCKGVPGHLEKNENKKLNTSITAILSKIV